jgi:hypothetical protein
MLFDDPGDKILDDAWQWRAQDDVDFSETKSGDR